MPRIATWLIHRLLPGVCGLELAADVSADYRDRIARGGWLARMGALVGVWRQILAPDTWRLRQTLRRQRYKAGGVSGFSAASGGSSFDALSRDARHAVRVLIRHPYFVLPAIAIIAFGIALSSSLFAVVDAVLLKPYPYADAERIVLPRADHTARGGGVWDIDRRVFAQLRETAGSLESVEGQFGYPVTIETSTGAISANAARVTGGFFDLLGAAPLYGRTISADDRGVVMLSHDFWQSSYGADPAVVGAELRLDDLNPRLDPSVAAAADTFSVIGVMPPGFTVPSSANSPHNTASVWIPLHMDEAIHRDSAGALATLARLAPGHTAKGALADTTAVFQALREGFPEDYESVHARVLTLRQIMVGRVRGSLLLLSGAAICLLLVVVSNVGNLFVTRALLRAGELAVRRALGANTMHLYRLALFEGLAVCVSGGALGLIGARWLLPVVVARAPTSVARLSEATIDLRVAIVVGLVVAASAVASSLMATAAGLREDTADATRRTRWQVAGGSLHSTAVLAQVAITVLLLSGSFLMLGSIGKLAAIDAGFDTEGRLYFSLFLPQGRYPTKEAKIAVTDELYERIEAIPGIHAVGGSDQVPPVRYNGMNPFVSLQHPEPFRAGLRTVTRRYPEAAGLRLSRGRMFANSDDLHSQRVVLVSEMAAEIYWPGSDPIGEELWIDRYEPWGRARVVGVVETMATYFADGVVLPEVYQLHEQDPWNQQRVLLHVAGDPAQYGDAIREAVAGVDPMLPVNRLRPLQENVDAALAPSRFLADLLGVFTVAGLVLAAVGIFGVMSFAVAQSSREMALRLAVGATPGNIMKLILGRASAMAGFGAVVGVGSALLLGRFLESRLYEVSPRDPASLTLAAAVVGLVALVSTVPAGLRAARVDPSHTLKSE